MTEQALSEQLASTTLDDKKEVVEVTSTTAANTTINIRETLNENEIKILDKIKQHFENKKSELTERQLVFLSDERVYVRYLRARDWDFDKSCKLLEGSIKWIEEIKAERISAKELKEEAASGKLFVYRHLDKHDRPIVFMTPGKENTYNHENNIKLVIYNLLRASRIADSVNSEKNKLSQMTWVCNFAGYSLKNAPPIATCKQTVDILGDQFPERLGNALIINPPKVFSWFWKLISPFIPSATKEKIRFCYSKDLEEQRKFLSEFIDLDILPKSIGGNCDFEFNEKFWEEEIVKDEDRISKLTYQ
ncbi:hypothetical protein ABK040_016272 [Willaertia magna]